MQRGYTRLTAMSIPKSIHAFPATSLGGKALKLRASIDQAHSRLRDQKETLERLRAEASALQELARRIAAGPPPTAIPAPISKRRSPAGLIPYAALALFALAAQIPQRRHEPVSAAAASPLQRSETALEADGDEGGEAVALVQEWRAPGDERILADRLGGTLGLPGTRSPWSTERTGEKTYRVSFEAGELQPRLEFDVDLDARRVDPSPDTAQFLTPSLAALR